MTATGWTDDVVDLPLTYSFAYHVALVAAQTLTLTLP